MTFTNTSTSTASTITFTTGSNFTTSSNTSTITFTSSATGWYVWPPKPKAKPKPKPPRFKKGDMVRVESSGILNNRVGKMGAYMPTKERICMVTWADGGWASFAEDALVLIPPKKAKKRPNYRGSVYAPAP